MSQCQIVSCDILLELLEISFNNILYARQLYPREIFTKKKIYSSAVYKSEHPEVNEYFKNILLSIRELLNFDVTSIKKINFVICEGDQQIEKFVFDLFNFRITDNEKDPYFLKTEDALRELTLKLLMSDNYLHKLPEDRTFFIEIETNESAHIGLSENPQCLEFPWISKEPAGSLTQDTSYLLPLKTIKTEYLGLQIYAVTSNPLKK
ncbi:mitotic spindle assembly checkpoint protein MAD2B [Microplitis demolitor]|uniref:mitotic spindle assembly checkpoint protein MAD2B n=1 Tax=Microplitis demolitor TaxID=69319 RepID=UPI0004CCDE90|nr:mitotic spindle assembly checkpoint protein MAD2B [Microplitis demolitor]